MSHKSERKAERKKARRLAHKIAGKDAIRYRIAEHLFERRLLEPTTSLILAGQILADIRPMLEAEIRHELENQLHDPGKPGEQGE